MNLHQQSIHSNSTMVISTIKLLGYTKPSKLKTFRPNMCSSTPMMINRNKVSSRMVKYLWNFVELGGCGFWTLLFPLGFLLWSIFQLKKISSYISLTTIMMTSRNDYSIRWTIKPTRRPFTLRLGPFLSGGVGIIRLFQLLQHPLVHFACQALQRQLLSWTKWKLHQCTQDLSTMWFLSNADIWSSFTILMTNFWMVSLACSN